MDNKLQPTNPNNLIISPDHDLITVENKGQVTLAPTPIDPEVSYTPPKTWGQTLQTSQINPLPETNLNPTSTTTLSNQIVSPESLIPPLPPKSSPNDNQTNPEIKTTNNIFVRSFLTSLSLILIGVLIGVLIARFLPIFSLPSHSISSSTPPTNYSECLQDPKSVIQESYPVVCVSSNGSHFVQPVSESSPSAITYSDTFQKITFTYSSSLTISGSDTSQINLKNTSNSLVFASNLYLNTLINSQFQEDKKSWGNSAVLKNIRIGVYDAKEAVYNNVITDNEKIAQLRMIYLQRGKDLYVLSLVNKNLEGEQILSSFRFLDSSVSASPTSF